MSSSFRRRAVVALAGIVILGSGCGGDATGPATPAQPQPPAGSATQVPRVLGLSTIDGKSLPAMHYTSPTYNSDAWTDSGSATLQEDSMLVIRAYTRWVDHGAGSQAPASHGELTSAGRLHGNGIAILPYVNGTADTAFVHADGAIEAHLSLDENGMQRSFGTFLFARAYAGGALNPVPYIRVISPDTAPEFADSAIVTLYGSSFLSTTQATWDRSIALTVRYVNPNQITVVIPAQDLMTAGTHPLTISNPAPGGGDRIYQFPVTIPEPAIVSISPTSAAASGGDFTLHVHGRGFISGKTQVLWNGSPRTSTVSSPTDLTATIPNADIATAGTYQVAVQTVPPGGGTTGVIAFTVTGTPAQKLAEDSTVMWGQEIIADPTRQLVYATAAYTETTYSHDVVAIDPTTGKVVWTVDIGGVGTKAAISGDGQFLYAFVPGAIVRVALASHTVDLRIPVGSSWIQAMTVMPGQPRTIAVLEGCGCANPVAPAALTIYDDAQPRAQTSPSPGTWTVLAFSTPQMLEVVSDNWVSEYSVTPTGVTPLAKNVAQLSFGTTAIAQDRVFTGSGSIYDFSTHTLTQIPGFPGSAAVVPSSDGQLMYAVGTAWFVRSYDVSTGAETGAVGFGGNAPSQMPIQSMVRWGQDGVALLYLDRVRFVRASFIH